MNVHRWVILWKESCWSYLKRKSSHFRLLTIVDTSHGYTQISLLVVWALVFQTDLANEKVARLSYFRASS